jgi:futalosine hydrolase
VRILIICAVAAERYAVVRNLGSTTPIEVADLTGVTVDTAAGEVEVFEGGPGPVAAALSTAMLLALRPAYDLVVSTGIAGGFRGRAEIGDVVLAEQVIAADQGVMTVEGFSTLRDLGLPGNGGYAVGNIDYRARLAAGPYHLLAGDILTLSCMTGTDARAAELAARYPRAIAEAMEGYGVIEAIRRGYARTDADVPFAEIRAISNVIGHRDRSTWNIPLAFSALGHAMSTLLNEPLP